MTHTHELIFHLSFEQHHARGDALLVHLWCSIGYGVLTISKVAIFVMGIIAITLFSTLVYHLLLGGAVLSM